MTQRPRIALSLGPGGILIAEIPHEDGSTHDVTLPKGRELDVLWPILHAQQRGLSRVTGSPACPTQWNIDEAVRSFKAPVRRVDLTLDELDFGVAFTEAELKPPAPAKARPSVPAPAKPKHQRPVKVPVFPLTPAPAAPQLVKRKATP